MSKFEWFEMTKEEAMAANEKHIELALHHLYQTFIESELTAKHRGKAIQEINTIARSLGFPHLVRND